MKWYVLDTVTDERVSRLWGGPGAASKAKAKAKTMNSKNKTGQGRQNKTGRRIRYKAKSVTYRVIEVD